MTADFKKQSVPILVSASYKAMETKCVYAVKDIYLMEKDAGVNET